MTWRTDVKLEHIDLTKRVVCDYLAERLQDLRNQGYEVTIAEVTTLLGEIGGETLARSGVQQNSEEAPAVASFLLGVAAHRVMSDKNPWREFVRYSQSLGASLPRSH